LQISYENEVKNSAFLVKVMLILAITTDIKQRPFKARFNRFVYSMLNSGFNWQSLKFDIVL